MNLRQLRYFTRIVECGSLSRAARELNVAQPALSAQLAKLEELVGTALLVRTPHGVVPTENGLALYHHAVFLLRLAEQSVAVARGGSRAIQGMVSVGLAATTVAALGLSLVRRVRERYPGILLNVVEGMSGHIEQLLRLGQLDIAILFAPGLAPDLVIEPLFEEELFVIVPRDSRLVPRGRTSLALAEVARLPMILPTARHGLRQRVTAELERRGLRLEVIAEIDSLSLLMACVAAGMGATIKPMGAILAEGSRAHRWRALSVRDARLRRPNFLYLLPPDRRTAAAAAVAGELRAVVAELLADPARPGFAPLDGDEGAWGPERAGGRLAAE
ncbi:MAG: LysR substrate-binding domain-containing protein [Geminicoccaceae bacterium]|nr:LysR substrate-binding domain-containing protein [Geminicoccaceae bacterium]MCS7269024.1 LysR substrate-binding domain-containing protein [Geminicoccaceae bacterium]MCX7631467.1 LysR substrate-binding domain-containing protein [Geminicoccaceae bacterium]MDW8125900.1 LysR substrate-binding domain-containing protein [Geminicoccaceae bacterium]MDW8340292.1 LysR substrate-binding domain-containing protein [Geminicoccaceae bacterium]